MSRPQPNTTFINKLSLTAATVHLGERGSPCSPLHIVIVNAIDKGLLHPFLKLKFMSISDGDLLTPEVLKAAFIPSNPTLTCTVLSCPVSMHDEFIGADKR